MPKIPEIPENKLNDDRPGLQLLMADAKAKKFDVVVTTKLDRFSRNLRLLLQYEDELGKLGISYHQIIAKLRR